jgi:hypothetical protein
MTLLVLIGLAVGAAVTLTVIGQTDRKAALSAYGRQYCEEMGWQFLDETVSLKSLRLSRSTRGWVLVRRYEFDFSPDGLHRQRGELLVHPGWARPLVRTLEETAAHGAPPPPS